MAAEEEALSAEQGDVDVIREALAAKSQSVVAREEQFAALDRLAAALADAHAQLQRGWDAEVERTNRLIDAERVGMQDLRDRAEKAERALVSQPPLARDPGWPLHEEC